MARVRAKLGFADALPGDEDFVGETFGLLQRLRIDFTQFFRHLVGLPAAGRRRPPPATDAPLRDIVIDRFALDAWIDLRRARLKAEGRPGRRAPGRHARRQSWHVLRNWIAESAIQKAQAGISARRPRCSPACRSPSTSSPSSSATPPRRRIGRGACRWPFEPNPASAQAAGRRSGGARIEDGAKLHESSNFVSDLNLPCRKVLLAPPESVHALFAAGPSRRPFFVPGGSVCCRRTARSLPSIRQRAGWSATDGRPPGATSPGCARRSPARIRHRRRSRPLAGRFPPPARQRPHLHRRIPTPAPFQTDAEGLWICPPCATSPAAPRCRAAAARQRRPPCSRARREQPGFLEWNSRPAFRGQRPLRVDARFRGGRAQPVGGRMAQAVHPDDYAAATASIERHLHGHAPFHGRFRAASPRTAKLEVVLAKGRVVEWTPMVAAADGRHPLGHLGTQARRGRTGPASQPP